MFSYFVSFFLISCISKATSGIAVTPGPHGCFFFGSMDNENYCKTKQISAAECPAECTSFVYHIVPFDILCDTCPAVDAKNFPGLGDILKTTKPVYVCMRHNVENWQYYESLKSAPHDNIYLKQILKTFPNIKGFFLTDIYFNAYKEIGFPKFINVMTEHLKIIKDGLNVTIGFSLDARTMIDEFFGSNQKLTFDSFEKLVDHYMIDLGVLNTCTPTFKDGGVIPIDSKDANTYTLTKLMTAMTNLKIPFDKTYLKYPLWATTTKSANTNNFDLTIFCNYNAKKICGKAPGSADWCADTTTSLRDKAAFVKKSKLGGILVDTIEVDDNDGEACHCDRFPMFKIIVDGWNNPDKLPACPLLDRK